MVTASLTFGWLKGKRAEDMTQIKDKRHRSRQLDKERQGGGRREEAREKKGLERLETRVQGKLVFYI